MQIVIQVQKALLNWLFASRLARGMCALAKRDPQGECEMFGKPEWFKPKAIGWGLAPTTWQGWTYTIVWSVVLAVPFLWLLSRQQGPEALTWLTLCFAALIWDVRSILQAMRSSKESPDNTSAKP